MHSDHNNSGPPHCGGGPVISAVPVVPRSFYRETSVVGWLNKMCRTSRRVSGVDLW